MYHLYFSYMILYKHVFTHYLNTTSDGLGRNTGGLLNHCKQGVPLFSPPVSVGLGWVSWFSVLWNVQPYKNKPEGVCLIS